MEPARPSVRPQPQWRNSPDITSQKHARPIVPHSVVVAAKLRLDTFNCTHPTGTVTTDEVILALAYAGPGDYFMTTHLYWECECAADYFHSKDNFVRGDGSGRVGAVEGVQTQFGRDDLRIRNDGAGVFLVLRGG